jgi:alkylated DNA repair dioxygenase AlkB
MTKNDNIKSTLVEKGFEVVKESNIYIKRNFLSTISSIEIHEKLTNEIEWEQPEVKIFGKSYSTPRLVAWYGDEGIEYKYSGLTHKAKPWTDELKKVQDLLQNMSADFTFNSVLLNFYRDGNDKMGWHADNEKELGKYPIIASLNLGATRRMDFKNKALSSEKISIYLNSGDLLIMLGDTQEIYLHQIPKEKKVKSSRINLTFRNIKQD